MSDQNINEFREVIKQKMPAKESNGEDLLNDLVYELIPTTNSPERIIRDVKDQPILNAAITADVDIILTGDKDFLTLDMMHPKCMNVASFLEYESIEL